MQLLDRLQFGLSSRVPVVLQTEASECGLACLAMLLAHHGTITDLPTLRGRHGAMPQGMTVTDLARVAGVEQLATRAVRLEMHELGQLRLPCVLHWDLGHFVVLRAIRGERFLITDPAYGERSLSAAELSPRFSGVAVEAWPSSGFAPRQESQSISIRQLVGQVTGLWPTLWRVMSVSMGLEVLALLSPLFMQWIVDHVVISRDLDLLSTLAVGFVLLLLVQQLMTMLRAWLVLRVGTQLRVQWRSNVLGHLLRLPLDFFARRHLGDVMSRFGSISSIQQVLTGTFVEAALDGVMVLLALGLMLLYSPKLAAVAVVSVLLYAAIRSAWYGPLRRAAAERLVRSANESSHLLETVRGMRAIRLFSRHAERMGTWQALMVADVNAGLRVQKLEIVYRLVRRTLSGLFALLLLWLGARDVIAGNLSVGMLLAFLAYRGQFDSRFTELVNKWFELRMLSLDAQRLADIVLTPTEPGSGMGTASASAAPPEIELAGLHFRYAAGAPDVLADLTLTVPAGQSVAIAGPSGCGKTTLVYLLMGVYAPQRGSIRIDGVALEQLGLDAWRSQVGTVMQDDSLFAGSLADNIAFFDPKPDLAWVEQCARLASIHDDIVRMPMGYQTLAGDMGTTLSGGQKQRVLLARALYRRPRVLILDEATSHLDVAREAEVGRAIAGMPLTRIVVAHRPQTLASVDRVVEMAGGRIVRDETAQDYAQRTGTTRAATTLAAVGAALLVATGLLSAQPSLAQDSRDALRLRLAGPEADAGVYLPPPPVPLEAGPGDTLARLLAEPQRCGAVGELPSDLPLPIGTVLRAVICQNVQVRQGSGLAQQAQAALDRAGAQQQPALSLSSGVDAASGSSTDWSVALRLDWVLYDFGSRDAALRQSRNALAGVLAEQRTEVLTALAGAAQLFATAQANLGRMQASEVNLRTAQDSARVAEARHSAGAATLAEKLQAQTALAQARLETSRARSQWLGARGALALAMGLPVSRALEISPGDDVEGGFDQSVDLRALIDEARERHPRVAAARSRLAEARERAAVARADRWGSLGLNAQTGRSRASSESTVRSSTTAALGWTLPLFDRGNLAARERDAEGLIAQRSVSVEDALRQVELQIWQQGQALISEREGLRESRLVLDSAESSLRVAAGRYRQGVGSFSDVLTAQSAAANARFQLVEARANLRQAQLRLAAAVGRFGPL